MTNPKIADPIMACREMPITTLARKCMFKRKHPGAETMAVFQIEWRLSTDHMKAMVGANVAGTWQTLESECYGDAESANDRLKYFTGCSLGKVLDFRVSEREEKLG